MFTRTLLTVALIAASGVALAQTTTPSPTTPTAPQMNRGAGGGLATEGAAKAKLEASGYTGVKDLKKNADGSWSAKAMLDNKETAISIDAQGNVMSR